jgi:Outer membrane protein beta-barrel domain
MKKIFLILCIQFLILKVVAQDSLNLEKYYPKPKITAIEILVGLSSSTIRGIDPFVSSAGGASYYSTSVFNKTGFNLGFGLIHNFSKRFALHARASWEIKGVIQKTDSLSLSPSTGMLMNVAPLYTNETINDYITISLIPQLLIGKRSNINIGAGGYFSFLEESKIIYRYTFFGQGFSNTQGKFDKYDFGLSFNTGYSFSLKSHLKLTIQATCNYGIIQISSWRANSLPPLYNTSYSILIGMRFMNRKNKLGVI